MPDRVWFDVLSTKVEQATAPASISTVVVSSIAAPSIVPPLMSGLTNTGVVMMQPSPMLVSPDMLALVMFALSISLLLSFCDPSVVTILPVPSVPMSTPAPSTDALISAGVVYLTVPAGLGVPVSLTSRTGILSPTARVVMSVNSLIFGIITSMLLLLFRADYRIHLSGCRPVHR